jgi:hypothetical protein
MAILRNGQIPSVFLSTVFDKDGRAMKLGRLSTRRLRRAVENMRRQTGKTMRLSPHGAYRDLAEQRALTGTGHHNYYPGHSVHGWAKSVDIWNWRDFPPNTLKTIMAHQGYYRTIPSEPWHFERLK